MKTEELFAYSFRKGTKVVVNDKECEVVGVDFGRQTLIIVVEKTEDGTELIGVVNASSVTKVIE